MGGVISSPARRPATLVVAAAVLAAEGLFGLVLGGFVAVQTLIGKPSDLKKIADELEMAKAKEALERHRKEQEAESALR